MAFVLALTLLLPGQAKSASPALAAVFEIGKPAPDFSLPDMNDQTVSLASKSGKKLVLLVFWTTWSEKCYDEMAVLEALYQKYRPAGLEVLAINLDKEGIDKACLYADQWQISYPILSDEKLVTLEKFQVLVIPTVYFVSQGLLSDILVDFDQDTPALLEKKVGQYLAPPPPQGGRGRPARPTS